MYFFPTASPMNESCSWIAHSHIDQIFPKENNQTEILFKNGKRILFDVSYGSMVNQVHRNAQFRYSLEDRIKIIRSNLFNNNQHSCQITDVEIYIIHYKC